MASCRRMSRTSRARSCGALHRVPSCVTFSKCSSLVAAAVSCGNTCTATRGEGRRRGGRYFHYLRAHDREVLTSTGSNSFKRSSSISTAMSRVHGTELVHPMPAVRPQRACWKRTAPSLAVQLQRGSFARQCTENNGNDSERWPDEQKSTGLRIAPLFPDLARHHNRRCCIAPPEHNRAVENAFAQRCHFSREAREI